MAGHLSLFCFDFLVDCTYAERPLSDGRTDGHFVHPSDISFLTSFLPSTTSSFSNLAHQAQDDHLSQLKDIRLSVSRETKTALSFVWVARFVFILLFSLSFHGIHPLGSILLSSLLFQGDWLSCLDVMAQYF